MEFPATQGFERSNRIYEATYEITRKEERAHRSDNWLFVCILGSAAARIRPAACREVATENERRGKDDGRKPSEAANRGAWSVVLRRNQ